MSKPRLLIDPERVSVNARKVVEIGRRHGIEVMGVTKGVAGDPGAPARCRPSDRKGHYGNPVGPSRPFNES